MYSQIPEEIIRKVRNENDIVDIVGEYVTLKKRGRNYVGLCPFHNENTPSFNVNKDMQIFRCFGCGKSGNVITFIREIESFNFVEAVHLLADKVNMELPQQANQQAKLSEEAETLLSAYDWMTKYYYHLLKYANEGNDAKTYLLERGITEDTIDTFQLGYATTNSDFTIEFLLKKGFHRQSLVKAGLLSTRDNQQFQDIFRGRVIFPIKNHLGVPVAFGGRAFQGEEPKYLNSPEHELFHKGNILYNFDVAKKAIRKTNEAIIFEGYMDVIAAYQAGVTNAVATLGTALSSHQAKLLKRYVDTVIICYDADDAGQEASYESAKLLKQVGCEVKVAQMPNKMDPDDYIKSYGGEAFKENVINHSDSLFKFYMRYQRKHYDLTIESDRIAYVEEMIAELAKIDSAIEREFHVKEIADEFNLSTEIIHYDIDEHKKKINRQYNDERQTNSNVYKPVLKQSNNKMLPAYNNAERFLLAHMFEYPHIIDKVQQTLGMQFNIEEHKVILTHVYALYEEYNEIKVSHLIDTLEDDYLKQLVTEIAMIQTDEMITEEVFNDYVRIILAESTDVAYLRSLEAKQKQEKNPILAAQIGIEIIEVERRLNQM